MAQALSARGIQILATGGTAALLRQHGIPLTTVSDYTGFPEILDGRVKTLHPKIYAGLLRRPGLDEAVLDAQQIEPIDLLVVNLYPFQETKTIEQIDIGGPAMLRAAAKNHIAVTVIVDPTDYEAVLNQIKTQGHTTLDTRRYLAKKVFAHTAAYDQAIFNYFNQPDQAPSETLFPDHYQPLFNKKMDLRYGENPHQAAAWYETVPAIAHTLAQAQLLQGKPLSYNNLLDSDAAWECVRALDSRRPACAIIKHNTPCGVAQADTVLQAYQQALTADPTSAFGGIIAFNQPLDADTAAAIIHQQFVEVLLAPSVTHDALQLLKAKPLWRILACTAHQEQSAGFSLRSISGGLLVQQADEKTVDRSHFSVPTQRQPSAQEWLDLEFAWTVVRWVKSNAIVTAKNQTTLGIGGGQTSRVFSAEIAVLKARQMNLSLSGAVAASDAFFPFADGLDVLANAGIRAVIQPGGSKRDDEVIAAANRHDIAMVFTGIRHFRH